MTVKTIENVPIEIKLKAHEVEKYFENGESVKILHGTHSGETGVIMSSEGQHAILSMDVATGAEELRFLLSNLQSKKETQDHIKLKDYI